MHIGMRRSSYGSVSDYAHTGGNGSGAPHHAAPSDAVVSEAQKLREKFLTLYPYAMQSLQPAPVYQTSVPMASPAAALARVAALEPAHTYDTRDILQQNNDALTLAEPETSTAASHPASQLNAVASSAVTEFTHLPLSVAGHDNVKLTPRSFDSSYVYDSGYSGGAAAAEVAYAAPRAAVKRTAKLAFPPLDQRSVAPQIQRRDSVDEFSAVSLLQSLSGYSPTHSHEEIRAGSFDTVPTVPAVNFSPDMIVPSPPRESRSPRSSSSHGKLLFKGAPRYDGGLKPFSQAVSPADGAEQPVRKRRRPNQAYSHEQTSTLRSWLEEHQDDPYPTAAERRMLCDRTGLTSAQVSQWFTNARRRYFSTKPVRKRID